MSKALSFSPASATKWTVLTGPMRGTVRLMNSPEFSVGRSPECEFVIVNDPKCSRKHALVSSTGYECSITSLNDKNPVLVNGREIENAPLNDGDVITFGETQVEFNLTTVPVGGDHGALSVLDPGLDAVPRLAADPAPLAAMQAPSPPGRTRRRRIKKPTGGSGLNRLILYGTVGLIIFWLASPSGKKKAETAIRTEKQIQADIEAATKLREAAEIQNMRRVDQSVTARQAQENYVRGFRDFHKGQFERSLTSFQACLALNPEHALCNRYLRLAQRKFNELVQYQIVLGRKYREQNQYKSCRAAFRNVMVMIKDSNSPAYQEAKANFEACNAMVEGRY
ncbi:MAG: FHA domain-containing protein [Calothrix sp. SM1_5_4]|nr:FHA domain-containing protein [Calothrix sp. SM1_5_4]